MWRLLLVVLFSFYCQAQSLRDYRQDPDGKLCYRALLIGIDTYQDARIPRLTTPVRDCKALQKLLENEFGFTNTVTLFNEAATRVNIDKAFRRMSQESRKKESILIYYAGHGELDQVFGNYAWLPADARSGVMPTYLPNHTVQKYVAGMKARHVLLLSDSSYAENLFAKVDLIDNGREPNFSANSRLGVTSGANQPVTDGAAEGHSLFATYLLYLLNYYPEGKYSKHYRGNSFSAQQVFHELSLLMATNNEKKVLFRRLDTPGVKNFGMFSFTRKHKIGSINMESFRPPNLPEGNEQVQALIDEAMIWYVGSSGTTDEERAGVLLRAAAQLDDPLAKMWEARYLLMGRCGYPKDVSKAVEIARENLPAVASAAVFGNEAAFFLLGYAYGQGLGVLQDKERAIFWYTKSATLGNSLAQTYLGILAPSDEADYWDLFAAEQGNAHAEIKVGIKYLSGEDKNLGEALKWHKKAAERGLAEAQIRLGDLYADGNGGIRDDKEAIRWYRLAAEQGVDVAQNYLAQMYEHGLGTPQDKAEAIKWYRLAAEQCDVKARRKLTELGGEL